MLDRPSKQDRTNQLQTKPGQPARLCCFARRYSRSGRKNAAYGASRGLPQKRRKRLKSVAIEALGEYTALLMVAKRSERAQSIPALRLLLGLAHFF
jgi:hypothetical protein